MKYRRHVKVPRKTKVRNIPGRTSMHDRPAEANGKRFRDWEMDLVIGKGLFPYRKDVPAITTDNGSEFACHEKIARRLGTAVYFAGSYASWQKGTVENANKLVRQYMPKGTGFREISD